MCFFLKSSFPYGNIPSTLLNSNLSLCTFIAAGHVTTLPHNCSGSIAILSTMCWLGISTFSNPCLYATDCLSTETPLAPFTPATINLKIDDQNTQFYLQAKAQLHLMHL